MPAVGPPRSWSATATFWPSWRDFDTMRLGDHVTARELKQVNLLLLLESARAMGGGPELLRRCRARAKLVRESRLQQLLDELPDVPVPEAPKAWSHWMSLVTTRQPFFDANHR